MTITVTQADIDWSFRGSASLCPIALSLKRHLVMSGHIATFGGRAIFIAHPNDPAERHLNVPPEAVQFMCAFDAGESVTPFTFELEAYDGLGH